MTRRVVLGTRGSRLALRQVELTLDKLRDRHPEIDFDVQIIQTEGDRVQDRPVSQLSDKGVFVRAIEAQLLDGSIDLAVHSLKDVPGDRVVSGLTLAAYSAREDPRDVLLSASGKGLAGLPSGARVGTSSLRRRVQLQAVRPDLEIADIRGNVDTRLAKVKRGEYDAIILAAAGLLRLGMADAISEYLPIDAFVPDACQGIMAVQGREGDEATRLARDIDDREGHIAAMAERAVVRALGADCGSPVGAYALIEAQQLRLRAMAATEDGSRLERGVIEGPLADAEVLGAQLGGRLLRSLEEYGRPPYTGP